MAQQGGRIMDILDGIRVLFRWWFVTIPMVALTVAAAVVVTDGYQPEFQADGSLLFVGPTVTPTGDETSGSTAINPLLEQPAALTTTAVVSSLALQTPQVASTLAAEGLSTDYDVGTESRLPILLIQTRAESRDAAIATALRLFELVDRDIEGRQEAANVPADQRVTTNVIGISAVGGPDYGGRMRMRLVIALFGLGATAGIAFLLDGVRRRRTIARSAAAQSQHDPSGDVSAADRGSNSPEADTPQIDAPSPSSPRRSTARPSKTGTPVDADLPRSRRRERSVR